MEEYIRWMKIRQVLAGLMLVIIFSSIILAGIYFFPAKKVNIQKDIHKNDAGTYVSCVQKGRNPSFYYYEMENDGFVLKQANTTKSVVFADAIEEPYVSFDSIQNPFGREIGRTNFEFHLPEGSAPVACGWSVNDGQ